MVRGGKDPGLLHLSSPRRTATKSIQLVPVKAQPRFQVRVDPSTQEQEVGASSADEMTVNELAEKKRRLISRVLAPNKRSKYEPREDEVEDDHYEEDLPVYEQLTIDTDKDRFDPLERELERRRKKEKKRRKKEKERERERKMRVLQLEREKREAEEVRHQDTVLRLSDESEVEDTKENTSPKKTKGTETNEVSLS